MILFAVYFTNPNNEILVAITSVLKLVCHLTEVAAVETDTVVVDDVQPELDEDVNAVVVALLSYGWHK